jgi:lipopolysaccharide biosynthesis regulator YciM
VTALWIALAAGSFLAFAAVLVVDRRRRRHEAKTVLKGVRSVISGDRDAAIEALSDAARLGTPEAVDTYLALGALFRREGDLARAIRLHRNMLLGPALDPSRRPEVERELAEDYRRSGMLAEAADLFARLASADPLSLAGLRDVRFDQGDLGAAVEAQRRLGAGTPDPVLAHLLAAWSRDAASGAPGRAAALAREALAADPSSADAHLADAEARAGAGDVTGALEAAGRALDADPRAAVLAWPSLVRAGDGEAILAFVTARAAARRQDAALRLLQSRALVHLGRRVEALEAARAALELDRTGEVTVAMRELLRAAEAPGAEGLRRPPRAPGRGPPAQGAPHPLRALRGRDGGARLALQAVRRLRLLSVAHPSSAVSCSSGAGLARCASKPAARERSRSSGRA